MSDSEWGPVEPPENNLTGNTRRAFCYGWKAAIEYMQEKQHKHSDDINQDMLFPQPFDSNKAADEIAGAYNQRAKTSLLEQPAIQATLCPICGAVHPMHYANCTLNR